MSEPAPTTGIGWARVRRRAADGLTSLLLMASLASIAGLLARLWWPLELFSNFRLQYLIACVLLAAGLFGLGRRLAALAAVCVAMLNLIWVAPVFLSSRSVRGAAELRLMSLNLNSQNQHYARVLEAVRAEDPDLLLLLEVNERWRAALAPLAAVYPRRIVRPREDNFGIGLWTRLPVDQLDLERLGSTLPSAVARLHPPQGPLTLVGTHPPPPAGSSLARERDEQLGAVARLLSSASGERVLLGDLNLTPWSPIFDDLQAASGLVDTRQGFGLQATWPTWFWPLFIPIDHCLVSKGLEVVDRRVGPDVGSDHRPIIIDLRFAQAPGPTRDKMNPQ